MKPQSPPQHHSAVQTASLLTPGSLSGGRLLLVIFAAILLPSLYMLAPRYSLLFHTVAVLSFVMISFGIFIIAWNVRKAVDHSYILFLGLSFLLIGLLNTCHALLFDGMNLVQGINTFDISYHFESAAILVKAGALFAAPFLLTRKLPTRYLLFFFALLACLLFGTILFTDLVPPDHTNHHDITGVRVLVEFFATALLIGAIITHIRNKQHLSPAIYQYMLAGIIVILPNGIIETFHIGSHDLHDFVWYALSFFSYFFIYCALIQAGLIEPQSLLYQNLQNSRKEIEKAKRDWEMTFDCVPVLIAIIDKDHTIKRVNTPLAKLMKMTPKEAVGKKCFEFFHGTKMPIICCPHSKSIKNNKPYELEINEEKLNAHLWITTTPITNEEGEPYASVHTALDITRLKQAEEELREVQNNLEILVDERTQDLRFANIHLRQEIKERLQVVDSLKKSEDKFRRLSQEFNALLDAIPDILLLVSKNSLIIWANTGAGMAFHTEPAKMVGKHYCEYFQVPDHSDDSEPGKEHTCIANGSFQTARPQQDEIILPDDRIIDLRSFPILDYQQQVTNVILVGTDITEKLALEKQALRNMHLSSLGELAAGVAHEINNPINGIINYAQLIARYSANNSEAIDISKRIIKEGDRIAGIVSSLLSFARGRQHEEKQFVAVGGIIDDTLSLVGAQLQKDRIHFELDLPVDLPLIYANPHQIEQVFLNLISNARHALNQKFPQADLQKKLSVTATSKQFDEAQVVCVSFQDQGEGISKNIIDKIMDPFFSTKPVGSGTGLGLSISHGIVVDHGGKLSIKSDPGEYTRVDVELPTKGTK